jgi:CubicO group peptidase (beta-lactamase class C family)
MDPQQQRRAGRGLRMRPRDLAKIGQLALDRGRWGDRQIVPADWLEQSFAPRVPIEDGLDYGYQWWLGEVADGEPWIAGFGNGGQRLTIIPSRQLVVVIMAGNYNAPDSWRLPVTILSEILLPSLRE